MRIDINNVRQTIEAMSTQIDQDAILVLGILATAPRNEYVDGLRLSRDSGLDPDRINDAIALLVDAGHANWNQVFGTAPFDFGDVMITPRGRHHFQRSQASAAPVSERGTSDPLTSSTSSVQLFISHCSDDVELAAGLIALLRVALNLPSSAIHCSSVDGYRLPGGANTDEQLRREVHDAEAFVGIVSSASVRSMYVLFELGARWGVGRQMIPLLAPGTPTSVLGGPLAGLNALSAESISQLHQLLSELATALSVKLESAASYHQHIQALTELAVHPADPHPAQATQVTGATSELPREAERVLKVLAQRDAPTAEDIALVVILSEQKVQYFLDVVKERELAEEIKVSGRPSHYVLTSKGRKYLFEHGMIE